MSDAASHASSRLPWPLHLVRDHARLFVSIGVSCATFAVESIVEPQALVSTRLLIAWNAGVFLYLVLAVSLLSRFEITIVRQRAAIHDEGGVAILIATVAAAVASLAAIGMELGAATAKESRAPYLALAAVTIVLSWTFIHVIFALHYAHEYYGEGEKGGGLAFPQDDCPDYWDFVYFAFTVGMTFQVSDVQVTSKQLRRAVVAHGAIAFVFSVAIVALFVNLGAALIQSPG